MSSEDVASSQGGTQYSTSALTKRVRDLRRFLQKVRIVHIILPYNNHLRLLFGLGLAKLPRCNQTRNIPE
jgi:hypothetical protein